MYKSILFIVLVALLDLTTSQSLLVYRTEASQGQKAILFQTISQLNRPGGTKYSVKTPATICTVIKTILTVSITCPGICPAVYAPVCGAWGRSNILQTFSNLCNLQNAQRCNQPWTLVYNGVCAQTYSNVNYLYRYLK